MILNFSRTLLLALVTAVSITGCASNASNQRSSDLQSAEGIYNEAKRFLNQGDFISAIDSFEILGARYPFGTFTQQAQLDIAFAYLQQDDFDGAIDAADRFIKLYPRNENIDYAHYIKGVSHFSRGGSAMESIFPRDMAKVDQNWLRASFAEFDNLVRQFPDSQYVPDAQERMRFLIDQMARHELITAQFYYDRGAMVAVVNRVNFLLERFEGSKHVPNALALMASAYQSMGQTDMQNNTLRVLSLTDPKHPAAQSLSGS